MYDDLYDELVEKGLTSDEDAELEGYYLFNNSLTKNVRIQLNTNLAPTSLDLNNQNPTLNLDTDTMSVCLSPKIV